MFLIFWGLRVPPELRLPPPEQGQGCQLFSGRGLDNQIRYLGGWGFGIQDPGTCLLCPRAIIIAMVLRMRMEQFYPYP